RSTAGRRGRDHPGPDGPAVRRPRLRRTGSGGQPDPDPATGLTRSITGPGGPGTPHPARGHDPSAASLATMMRLLRILVSLVLVLLGLLSWAPQEARAADEDVVRNLEVTYDVRPDGSVHVRYSLDWQFAERGRHGIELSLVTAEPWDDDPLQEAVYEISDLEVSSPS